MGKSGQSELTGDKLRRDNLNVPRGFASIGS